MAVPAGRSVVFVTGNAKKLEEVRVKYVVSEADCMLNTVLCCLSSFKQDICAFVYIEMFRIEVLRHQKPTVSTL